MIDLSPYIQLGIAGIAVVGLLWFVFNFSAKLIDSYNANTKALNRLATVTERSLDRDQTFQQEILKMSKETNEKVKDIHNKVVMQID